MNANEAQRKLTELFKQTFGNDNVKYEWRSNASAEDWLKFNNIYAPRPDIAIGPFNVLEGRNTTQINNVFNQNSTFFNRLNISANSVNENPRCLIAIEIENSNKGKHMMGNLINASLLGRVGLVVTVRDEFYSAALEMRNYLQGAFERKKMGHNPSNIAIIKYKELHRILREDFK